MPQTVRQPRQRDFAEGANEIGEPPKSEQQIAHEQQRPSLAYHF
jgi:hypothetical protein